MGRNSNKRKTKILVVEDEPVTRKLCVEVVRAHGYEVLEAASLGDAEQQCRTVRPHAAIQALQAIDMPCIRVVLRLFRMILTSPDS